MSIALGTLVLSAGYSYCGKADAPLFRASTESPDSAIRVTFDERTRPADDRLYYVNYVSAQNDEAVLIDQFAFFGGHTGGLTPEPRLIDQFEAPEWTDSRTLHFPIRDGRPSADTTLVVRNDTSKVVGCMVIECDEIYLMFDLKPGDSTQATVRTSFAPGGPSYVRCFGAFVDGNSVPDQGTDMDSSHRGRQITLRLTPGGAQFAITPSLP